MNMFIQKYRWLSYLVVLMLWGNHEALGQISVSNSCPATTVDLSTHVTSTPPVGAVVTWHTGTPATNANKVANASAVGAGTYYAAYFDATNSCYSPTSTPVQVTITNCSGNVIATNTCPATTVDLSTHVTSTPPAGAVVTWHTGTPATTANKVANASAVGAGTYYAAYFDATNSCYSPTSTPVQVNITSCGSVIATNTCPATTVDLSTHVTSTPPAGAVVTWHTGTPATTANKVANASAVGAGTYYAAYFDATNSCYSPTSTPVQVNITSCGSVIATNTCPVTTVDLSTHVTSTPPIGATVTWHTGTPATAANKVANASAVGAGTYYAAYFDATNSCYSPTSTPVQVTITACNQSPVVTPDVNTFIPGTPTAGNVLTNDKDPEGSPLTASVVGTTPPGFVLTPDGSYTYTAPASQTSPVTVVYQACDSNTPPACATATLTITPAPNPTPANDAPVALNDATHTTAGTPVKVPVLANDKDPEGLPLSNPTIVNPPAQGTASVNPDGTITYTPPANFTGTVTFVYQVCDTGTPPACSTAQVTVAVDPTPPASQTNLAPVAIDDLLLTTQGVAATGTVAANDSDPNPGQTLTFTKLTNPVNGTVQFNPNGTFSYTPSPTFVGTDNFVYQVCDNGTPVLCTTATAYMTVNQPANQSPVVTPDVNTFIPGLPTAGNVLTNDKDPEGTPLTASVVGTPPPGLTLSPDGSYTYTPPASQTSPVTVVYQACDSNTPPACATATLTITPAPNPTPANDAPVALNDATRTTAGTPVKVPVLGNDKDPEGLPLSNPTIVNPPAQGTASVNPDGTITYTPPANFTGTVTFVYQVCDTGTPPACSTAGVTVAVDPTPPASQTNLAPVAIDDLLLTTQGIAATGTVAANDSDPNPGQTLAFTKLTNPTNGTVVFNPDGTYTYTPSPTFVGTDNFVYQVCDNGSPVQCATATAHMTVNQPAGLAVLPQAWLQGALFGVTAANGVMRDDLRTKGYLPASSPYSNFTALTTVGPISNTATVFGVTGNNAIVDWVFVELRSPSNMSLVVDSRPALIQRDGDIVEVDGVSPVLFSQVSAGSFYVSVRHRNHLGVMTATAIPLSTTGTVVDFRTPATPAYRITTTAVNQSQVTVAQGVALWAGNVLYDKSVIYQGTGNDVSAISVQVKGPVNVTGSALYVLNGYYTGDVNLDGRTIYQGTGNDVNYIYQNVTKNHPGNIAGQNIFVIREQLP